MKHLSANMPAPRRKARIEIIPLIDIMFFLLASFMLIALAMIRLQGMAMNLPSKTPPPPPPPDQPKPEVVKIDVSATGEFSIEKVPISAADLESLLQKKFDADVKENKAKENLDTRVFINADPNSTHGMVIDILDKVRTIGIKKVSFSLKMKTPGAPGTTTTGTAPPAAPAAPAAPAPPPPPAPTKP
jgi:biopolymer transport protein ExbD